MSGDGMTWFKVSDDFYDHPKVVQLAANKRGREALCLWILAGSWSAKQLTDGLVPHFQLQRLGFKKPTGMELVRSGLWIEVDDGFRFHDWHKYQPTKEKVEADRDAARARMRNLRTSSFTGCSPERSVGTSGEVPVGTGSGSRSSDLGESAERGVAADPEPSRRNTTFSVRVGYERRFLAARGVSPAWGHKAAQSAAEVAAWVDAQPDPARDLERALDGFFADPWATSKGFPIGALSADPVRYHSPPKPAQVEPSREYSAAALDAMQKRRDEFV